MTSKGPMPSFAECESFHFKISFNVRVLTLVPVQSTAVLIGVPAVRKSQAELFVAAFESILDWITASNAVVALMPVNLRLRDLVLRLAIYFTFCDKLSIVTACRVCHRRGI